MIFTFYSYKGGVGRSMAMAGIAHLLARRGLRVLAIDFDLEAPGLERYFFDGERCRTVREQRGLLDLVKAYRLALSSEAAFAEGQFKHWQNFRLTAINVAGALGGSVDLMTAGQREPETAMRDYALSVRSFNWQDFFDNWKGDLFFDWLRRQLRDPATGYDVVLVDSRTGVTEMGGVCAYQLADVAVLLCAPNYQNLEGTRDVARDFRSDGVRALRQGRPLEIVAVPARLEATHPRRAEFLARFKEELGVEGLPAVLAAAGLDYENLALPYLPQFAVAERLVGDPQTDSGESAAPIEVFERLADALTLLAPPDTPLGRMREQALQRLTGGAASASVGLLADTTRSSAGYDAFIEHSLGDDALAAVLVRTLESQGFRAIASCAENKTGGGLNPAFEQALDYSQALLVCFGQPTLTEARAQIIAKARRLQTVQIVPVLLPGADPQALASFDLSLTQALDLRDWPADEARQRLREALDGGAATRRPAPRAAAALPEHDPYPGARAFSEDDAAFFFGREAEVAQLETALDAHALVFVTGPAQVGKTSLVQAGLVPALRQRSVSGGKTFGGLVWVDLGAKAAPRWPDWVNLPDAGRQPNAAPGVLHLLVIDGVDTFSVDGGAAARAARLVELERALKGAGCFAKVIVIARDTLPPDERDTAIGIYRQHEFKVLRIDPLSGAALRRAIDEPAKRAGHLLEPGLAERLIESAAGARGAIAQMQLALAAIWPDRKRGWLTNKNLDAAGHLGGIVGKRRIDVLAALTEPQRAAAQALFSRLVTLSGSYELKPSLQAWDPLATVPAISAVDSVVLRDQLAHAGLIDLFRGKAIDSQPDSSNAEVQVALTRPEPSVYFSEGGTEVDLRFLLWRESLVPLARRWASGSADAVLRGSALVEAQGWLESRADSLTLKERDYIAASVNAREQQQAQEDQRRDAQHAEQEAREREKREAAEALAAEQSMRLKIEEGARVTAQRDATRLRRGNRIAIASAVLATILLVVALGLVQKEKTARMQEVAARKQAEAARMQAEVSAGSAADALRAAQLSQEATVAALSARTDQARRQAENLQRQAYSKYENAKTAVQNLPGDCPAGRRVFLHIGHESERTAAHAVIPALQAQNYSVPGTELVDRAPPVTDVRYFHADEEAGARELAQTLRGAGIAEVVPKLIKGFENSPRVQRCQYEIWFSDGALDGIGAKK